MKTVMAMAALALSSSAGLAATYQFNWSAGQNMVNNSAGAFDSITATFDTGTQRFDLTHVSLTHFQPTLLASNCSGLW